MTPELWETLTPQQQAEHCWQELTQMITAAVKSLELQAGNHETLVIGGLTTIIGERS